MFVGLCVQSLGHRSPCTAMKLHFEVPSRHGVRISSTSAIIRHHTGQQPCSRSWRSRQLHARQLAKLVKPLQSSPMDAMPTSDNGASTTVPTAAPVSTKALTGIMIYIMMRLTRQLEPDGMEKVFEAAEEAARLMKEARPVLQQSIKIQGCEVAPLAEQLKQGGLLSSLEGLTIATSAASDEVKNLQSPKLTPEDIQALRTSVTGLARALDQVENITSENSFFTRDSALQRNLQTLVRALEGMVDE